MRSESRREARVKGTMKDLIAMAKAKKKSCFWCLIRSQYKVAILSMSGEKLWHKKGGFHEMMKIFGAHSAEQRQNSEDLASRNIRALSFCLFWVSEKMMRWKRAGSLRCSYLEEQKGWNQVSEMERDVKSQSFRFLWKKIRLGVGKGKIHEFTFPKEEEGGRRNVVVNVLVVTFIHDVLAIWTAKRRMQSKIKNQIKSKSRKNEWRWWWIEIYHLTWKWGLLAKGIMWGSLLCSKAELSWSSPRRQWCQNFLHLTFIFIVI